MSGPISFSWTHYLHQGLWYRSAKSGTDSGAQQHVIAMLSKMHCSGVVAGDMYSNVAQTHTPKVATVHGRLWFVRGPALLLLRLKPQNPLSVI